MPYIGKQPEIGAYKKLDAITVVNGQAAYTLQSGSANYSPASANHLIVSLNGVIQAPQDSFTVSGSTLTFASNLSTGDSIDFILALGDVLDIGTPSDNTVTNDKLATAPTIISKGAGSDSGAIQLNCEVNTHGVKIKGPPHSAGQSYTLTLPSTAPSADKALITDGSGNLSFGSAGGLVKLNTTDITSSTATLNFDNTVITDTYDKYIVEYTGLKPVNDNVNLRSRVSSDNGSSFVTGTYHYGYHFTQLGGADGANSGSGKSNYALGDFALGNDAGYPYNGVMYFEAMRDTGTYLTIRNNFAIKNQNDVRALVTEGWVLDATTAYNYIEFSFSSGNIADGTFTLYGLAK